MSHTPQSILIDATVYTAFTQGEAEVVHLLQHATVHVCPQTVGDFVADLAASAAANDPRAFSRLLDWQIFLDSAAVNKLEIDKKTSCHFGDIMRTLRQSNTPLPMADIWTAALAVQHDLTLVTQKQHFRDVTGLRLHLI